MLTLLVALALSGNIATEASSGTARNTMTVHLIRRCFRTADCLPDNVVRGMKDETTAIWSSLDVRIAWIDSGAGSVAGRADVDLRVLLEESAEPGLAWQPQRGFLLAAVHKPETPGGSGLARIWVTQVRQHAASIRLQGFPLASLPDSLTTLVLARGLGRALAHEIGHYLLGTAQHRAHGLMRARFEPQELLAPATARRYGLGHDDLEALNVCRLNPTLLP
jgi:hypothetical protein